MDRTMSDFEVFYHATKMSQAIRLMSDEDVKKLPEEPAVVKSRKFSFWLLPLCTTTATKGEVLIETAEDLDYLGISAERLLSDAIQVASERFPAVVTPLGNVVGKENIPAFVISNSIQKFGASVIFYDGVLAKLADGFNDGFTLIPSSVDEMLAIPDWADISADYMTGLLRDINQTLEPGMKLSDNILHYDRKTGILSEITDGVENIPAADAETDDNIISVG